MNRLVKLFSSIDEYNFVDIFLVVSTPAFDVRAIESIPFVSMSEAQLQADYLNKKHNTTIYRVYRTSMFVG